MSSVMSADNSENTCVVCFKNVEIYSIGECDHPVCYECSTRMRVICLRNECPICRQDLHKVVFIKTVQPFKDLANRQYLFEDKYKICFENGYIRSQYEKLLEHRCLKCHDRLFPTFAKLSEHMSREHEMFYCDLCVENLKIFTFERRVYNRQDLAHHRRKGDLDDRSHRGHPNCAFCDCRFMDNDELYRHLRRDHFYCHFCDADGLHQFYMSYRSLRDHFQKEHYLCEEGDCINETLTSVFLTEIDLKAHKASVHTSGMSKAASKQARTLELEFTLAPRPRERPDRGHRDHRDYRDHREQQTSDRSSYQQQDDEEELGAVGGIAPRDRKPKLNMNDFPSLGAEAPSVMPPPMMQRGGGARRGFTISTISGRGPPTINDADYPALGPSDPQGHSKTVRVSVNSKTQPALSIQVNRVGRPSGPPSQPPLQQSSSSGQASKRPTRPASSAFDSEYYPPLTPLSAYQGTSSKEWVTTSSKTERGKTQAQSKVQLINPSTIANMNSPMPPPAPPAPLAAPTKQQAPGQSPHLYERNFPSLGPSKPPAASNSQASNPKWKKKSSVTIPMSSSWSNTNDNAAQSSDNEAPSYNLAITTKSKKKKKKGAKGNEAPKLANGTENSSASSSKKKSNDTPSDSLFKKSHENNKSTSDSEETPSRSHDRKRSELEIGHLDLNSAQSRSTESEPTSSGSDPTDRLLSLIRGDSAPSKPAPPGFDRRPVQPPPGFAPVSNVSCPPPGFEMNAKPAPLSNGLTFTNSSGESYPIQPFPNAQYVQPNNFQARNAALKAKLSEALSTSDAGNPKADFKDMSVMYRADMLPVEVYYDYCKVSMGEKAFAQIFPELICLLPDISKQQELYKVHMERSSGSQSKSKKKCLEVCSSCGQVLMASDLPSHSASHQLDSQFPSLSLGASSSSTSGPEPSGAWSRK